MLFVLQRSFTYFTLLVCVLFAGSAYRMMAPEMNSLEINVDYFSVFEKSSIKPVLESEIAVPEMAFTEIKFPEVVIPKKVVAKVKVAAPKVIETKVSKVLLPFAETIRVLPVQTKIELPKNILALYKDVEATPVQKVAETLKTDEVSTKLAATEEPEFFEYPVEDVAKTAEPAVEAKKEIIPENKIVEVAAPAVATDKAFDYAAPEAVSPVVEEESVSDLVAYDYSLKQVEVKVPAASARVVETPVTKQIPSVTTQATFQGAPVSFDYQTAKADLAAATIPTVAKVNTQPKEPPREMLKSNVKEEEQSGSNALVASKSVKTYPVKLNIHAVSTDLKGSRDTQGFDVRLMDDQSASLEDYGSGEVVLEDNLSSSRMFRTISMLKPGYVPTTTDAIFEAGESSMSIPLIDADIYNDAISAYEGNGPVGAILVELDDKTEYAKIDVPYGKIINLDGDLKVTADEASRYQLFMGVKAGNVLVSYKSGKTLASKILHVHEAELTYDANFYEKATNGKVSLVEEDLLSKVENPLIVSADLVREFATENTSQKVDDHTYKINFGQSLLGSRKYLELGHQKEPVFVGYRDAKKISVPSESFMRYILSSFEGKGMANRCVIQVNLAKKVVSVESGSESVGSNLNAQVQYLDRDGKFYDSASESTRKVIVLGENQGPQGVSPDGKVNLKVSYRDGSVEYLGSYCSPNTYLVEQL
jgi:hypothetical protein